LPDYFGDSFDMLLVGRRCLYTLGSFELIVNHGVLLWPPLLGWFRFDVLDPFLDRLDALLAVLLVFLVEVLRRV
jgi:hypothetical protein